MDKNTHTLSSIVTIAVPSHLRWKCSCGKTGDTTRAFEGEDLKAKARRNHSAHASRARKA